jgi:signal transduction histidine kinase
MELEVTDFDLPMAIDNAMTLIRERAARRRIALHTTVDERLGHVQADERKIRQGLLNLLSNAIKFTPEGGRIDVHAVPRDGMVEVSVTDARVGIAPEDQGAVFEEFRQVGTADKASYRATSRLATPESHGMARRRRRSACSVPPRADAPDRQDESLDLLLLTGNNNQ